MDPGSNDFEIAVAEVKTTRKTKQFSIDYLLNFSPKTSPNKVKIHTPIPEYMHPYPPVLRKVDRDQPLLNVSATTALRDSEEDLKAPSPTVTPTSGERKLETIGKNFLFFSYPQSR
jgi:hypothetical protein